MLSKWFVIFATLVALSAVVLASEEDDDSPYGLAVEDRGFGLHVEPRDDEDEERELELDTRQADDDDDDDESADSDEDDDEESNIVKRESYNIPTYYSRPVPERPQTIQPYPYQSVALPATIPPSQFGLHNSNNRNRRPTITTITENLPPTNIPPRDIPLSWLRKPNARRY